jgi:hypothetical protein
LKVAHGAVVLRVKDEPLDWSGTQGVAAVIEPRVSVKVATTGLCHGGNDASESPGFFGSHAGRLDLDL